MLYPWSEYNIINQLYVNKKFLKNRICHFISAILNYLIVVNDMF